MQKIDISAWPKNLERQLGALRPAIEAALSEIGIVAVETARKKIGHYQVRSGPFEAWAPLKPRTIAEKQRLGYTGRLSDDDPLYRTGEMRLSISYRIEGLALTIGSPDQVAKFQEIGTARIPPRPFIGPALFEVQPLAGEKLARSVYDVLTGRLVFRSPAREAAE